MFLSELVVIVTGSSSSNRRRTFRGGLRVRGCASCFLELSEYGIFLFRRPSIGHYNYDMFYLWPSKFNFLNQKYNFLTGWSAFKLKTNDCNESYFRRNSARCILAYSYRRLVCVCMCVCMCVFVFVCISSTHGDLSMAANNGTTYGRRSFAVSGRTTWNTLSLSTREQSLSLDQFRSHLKTELFNRTYNVA